MKAHRKLLKKEGVKIAPRDKFQYPDGCKGNMMSGYMPFIYFLLNGENVVYIGLRSSTLRIADHKYKNYDGIGIILSNSLELEQYYISIFQPVYNKVIKSGGYDPNPGFNEDLKRKEIELQKWSRDLRKALSSPIKNKNIINALIKIRDKVV